jgi:hypothetical protein
MYHLVHNWCLFDQIIGYRPDMVSLIGLEPIFGMPTEWCSSNWRSLEPHHCCGWWHRTPPLHTCHHIDCGHHVAKPAIWFRTDESSSSKQMRALLYLKSWNTPLLWPWLCLPVREREQCSGTRPWLLSGEGVVMAQWAGDEGTMTSRRRGGSLPTV